MNGRRVLVTGCAGFIGRHAVRHLTAGGWSVVGLDAHAVPDPLPGLVQGDLRNDALMTKLLVGVDAILHLASAHLQVNLPESEYLSVNVEAIGPLLQAAKDAGVRRFVHVSSVAVYGRLAEVPADEDTACSPTTAYGRTKLAGERAALEQGSQLDIPVVVLRPGWVYGPGCGRTAKLWRALRKRSFPLVGRARNLRHPLHVDDFLVACELALESDCASGEVVLVAGPAPVTSAELVEAFCAALDLPRPWLRLPRWLFASLAFGVEAVFGLAGREPPVSRRSLEFFDVENAFRIDKARELLGFEPRISLDEGLRATRDWLERP